MTLDETQADEAQAESAPASAAAPASAVGAAARIRPRVVTNDAMRDHVEGILSPRDFFRWRHSQILGFGIGPPGDDGSPPAASVSAVPTLTVEAQRGEGSDAGHVHIPVPRAAAPAGGEGCDGAEGGHPEAPEAPQEWLCISLPPDGTE